MAPSPEADPEPDSPAQRLMRLEPAALEFGALERLDLRNVGLTALPAALPLCARLRQLDVGANPGLRSLDGVDALASSLRVLFATGCGLGPELPVGGALSRLPALFMLALKENGLTALDGAALPEGLGWLIAAQNEIAVVRNAHRLRGVRKLMLSHNRLTAAALEPLLDAIPGLEMLRVACNRVDALPLAARRHPSLAWLALGGNPYALRHLRAASADAAPELAPGAEPAAELDIGDAVLGRGSGATVVRGRFRGADVAVKLWSAQAFSDGDARGEWEMGRRTTACAHVVRTLAVFQTPHLGMVLELLDGARAAGAPPTFATVTRDAVDARTHGLDARDALRVAREVCAACGWLHAHGITHGDVYLHNTLVVPEQARPDRLARVCLSDFGAAAAYDRSADADVVEPIEVRAFGKLLEDLVALCRDGPAAARVREQLCALAAACGASDLARVPSFDAVGATLRGFGDAEDGESGSAP